MTAASAAKEVMDKGVYSIYTTGGTTGKSYRTVFTNATPIAQEVMLAAIM